MSAYWQRLVALAFLEPLGEGPLAPEVEAPREPWEDDHLSALADDWRAEAREFERDDFDSIYRERT